MLLLYAEKKSREEQVGQDQGFTNEESGDRENGHAQEWFCHDQPHGYSAS